MVANLAVVFGWTLADCADFTIDELMDWNALAIERHQPS
ncbi:GpE family phage tail protein [Moraxella sp. Pampa]|nr:GpE family phage tail protein [Moraxella sp. Pampa]